MPLDIDLNQINNNDKMKKKNHQFIYCKNEKKEKNYLSYFN
jgi:hypothetical protein